MPDVTELLRRCHSDIPARGELFRLVYSHLHRIAAAKLQIWDQPPLQATELVNEAYLKLFGNGGATMDRDWKTRGMFYAFTAMVMANLLKDIHRREHAQKRGGGSRGVPLEDGMATTPSVSDEVILTLDLLEQLEKDRPVTGRIAKLHYCAGRPFAEIREILQASEPSEILSLLQVEQHWKLARAWIRSRLTEGSDGP